MLHSASHLIIIQSKIPAFIHYARKSQRLFFSIMCLLLGYHKLLLPDTLFDLLFSQLRRRLKMYVLTIHLKGKSRSLSFFTMMMWPWVHSVLNYNVFIWKTSCSWEHLGRCGTCSHIMETKELRTRERGTGDSVYVRTLPDLESSWWGVSNKANVFLG